MKPLVALLALALLTACTDNRVGVGFNFGPRGVSVSPHISGSIGAARIGVSG